MAEQRKPRYPNGPMPEIGIEIILFERRGDLAENDKYRIRRLCHDAGDDTEIRTQAFIVERIKWGRTLCRDCSDAKLAKRRKGYIAKTIQEEVADARTAPRDLWVMAMSKINRGASA